MHSEAKQYENVSLELRKVYCRAMQGGGYLILPKLPERFQQLFFFFLIFLELYLQHMEVPRLGVESELQQMACATATATAKAMPDPSHICNLHHSSRQAMPDP